MNLLIDKLILFFICLALYLPGRESLYAVVPIILVISLGALSSWLEKETGRLAVLLLFTLACMFEPAMAIFLPLMCFDLFAGRLQAAVLVAVMPLMLHFRELGVATLIQLTLLSGLAFFLKNRALHLEKARLQALEMRDSARETALRLENKNKELLDKQDYEINLATLNERNRIAREIHDHVGHLLTRAILQLGALLTTLPANFPREQLQAVKDTLGDSMDEIRHSLHDLHTSSLDLENELQKLADNFSFCPVGLEYSLTENPEPRYLYAFLAIVQEALANIARHSGADRASITLREHPGLYQLIIRDNGRGGRKPADFTPDAEKGIGLSSMEERIRKLDGQINFQTDGGWTIFITVPKSKVLPEAKK